MVDSAVAVLPELVRSLTLGLPSCTPSQAVCLNYVKMVRKWEEEQDRRAQSGMAWMYSWEYIAGSKLSGRRGIRRSVSGPRLLRHKLRLMLCFSAIQERQVRLACGAYVTNAPGTMQIANSNESISRDQQGLSLASPLVGSRRAGPSRHQEHNSLTSTICQSLHLSIHPHRCTMQDPSQGIQRELVSLRSFCFSRSAADP